MGQLSSQGYRVWINTREKEDMQDNIVLRVGEPFFIYFRNLRFSEVDVSVCVDGKRRTDSVWLGNLGLNYMRVKPQKHFKAVLMRPGRHNIRTISIVRGTKITEVIELDVLVVKCTETTEAVGLDALL